MILMICGIGTPSACEKSRTVTPDWTLTGPVGGATGCVRLGLDVLAVAGALAVVAGARTLAAACR